MKLAFVDTETTDLYPAKGARVIEVAVQLADVGKEGVALEGDPFVFRQRIDRAVTRWSPIAFKVNGYRHDHPDWLDTPMTGSEEAYNAWVKVAEMLKDRQLCSQNVPFDKGFIESELEKFDINASWDRRTVEIMSYSMLVAVAYGLPKYGLHQVYEALGGPPLQEHRALMDIRRGIFVVEHFHKKYFTP